MCYASTSQEHTDRIPGVGTAPSMRKEFLKKESDMRKWLVLVLCLSVGWFASPGIHGTSVADQLSQWVAAVNFFESGADTPAYKDRTYRTRFIQSLTRYINWEVNFKLEPLGKRLDYKIQAVWRKPDGSVLTKQKKDAYIEGDWTAPYTSWGYGSKAGGSYEPGNYEVEFFVQGRKIASGQFEVIADEAVGVILPTLWRGVFPLYPGATVLTSDTLSPASTMHHALVEMPVDKDSAFYFYLNRLKQLGWSLDKQLKADREDGSLENKSLWGILNLTRENETLTVMVPSDQQTGGTQTRMDVTLIRRLSGEALTEFVRSIPRVEVADTQMDRRFESQGWGLTVLSARVEGNQITKNQGFAPGRSYRFSTSSPGVYLLRITIELEHLNGKPINEGFLVKAQVRDADGQTHPCVAAGTELGEYYEYQKGGRQSLLLPVTAKDKIEYVFVLPVNAAAREFIWPGFDPITLRVD